MAPWGCASLKLSIPLFPFIYHPRSATIHLTSATIASIILRVCRCRARVLPPFPPLYRAAFTASARSTRSAPNLAAVPRSVSYRLQVKHAPIVDNMSSSGDDTPLVRGNDQGEFVHDSTFCTRYGYLTPTRRSSLLNSTLFTTQPHHFPSTFLDRVRSTLVRRIFHAL